MKEKIVATFTSVHNFKKGLIAALGQGAKVQTVYSPVDCTEILEEVGIRKKSPVPFAAFLGGLAGLLLGIGFAVYTFLEWRFVTSGKPTPPAVPLVVVGFEMTILFGFLSTLLFALFLCGMPRTPRAEGYDARFSKNVFGVVLECNPGKKKTLVTLMLEAGAEEVRGLEN